MARQNIVGVVVSQGKMNKTIKVRVQTKGYDKRVHKEIIGRKDFLVHDEGNICKEGDVVRIESIPKITSRKYFAVAEIKVNKGQQFEVYESIAREKLAQEEQQRIAHFLERRKELESIVTKVADLQELDKISRVFPSSSEEDRAKLIAQINEIKEKYGIHSWPSTEPVVEMKLTEAQKDLTVLENRVANIKLILDKMMSAEFSEQRTELLEQMTRGKYGPVESIKPAIQRNILRKWVLDPSNDIPVAL